tara:strand:- start:826 stop:1011 length:186 start_codon:yes stop_codon:yes gene_type:complete
MKIDQQGISEIKNTIETPIIALANKLNGKKQLTSDVSEIITFLLEKLKDVEQANNLWEIID